MVSGPYSYLPTETLVEAYQIHHLLNMQRAAQSYDTGKQEGRELGMMDNDDSTHHDDSLQSEIEERSEAPRERVASTAMGETPLATAGKLGLDFAKYVGPKIIAWFKAHQDTTNLAPPSGFSWDKFKLTVYHTGQIVAPGVVVILVLWQIYHPTQDSALILAGLTSLLGLILNRQGTALEKALSEADKKVIGSQALNLGLAVGHPELASSTGVSDKHIEGMMKRARTQQKVVSHWYDHLFNCFSRRQEKENGIVEDGKERSWCQRFSDCCGCFAACQNIFRKAPVDDIVDV